MTDRPPVQHTYSQEQAVSANAFMDIAFSETESLHVQITARHGASADDIFKLVGNLVEAASKIRGTWAKPVAIVPDPSEPTRVSVDENGNEVQEPKVFTASELVVDMHDNKLYTKVKGKPFEKFGVPVWPEVLEACNIVVKVGEPVPDIAGWTVKYIEKDGKEGKRTPDKVIALLPPKKS